MDTPFWNVDTNASVNVNIDENSKTWASSITNLYNIFIHKIQTNKIKQILTSEFNEKETDLKDYGSIKLLKCLLKDKNLNASILDVLDEIRNIRNACDAHQNQSEQTKIIDEIKIKHSSLQAHYKNLLERLIQTIIELQNILPKSQD